MKRKNLSWFCNPEHVFCYHYERLSEKEQNVYRKLAEGLFSFRPSITLMGTDCGTVETVYQKMKDDLPAAFFDAGAEMVWFPVLRMVKVRPLYRFSQQRAEKILADILEEMDPLLFRCYGRTDLEKETLIHDWLCRNVSYDGDYAKRMGGSSFEMAGPLLYGKGVCSGISKAAKFLFDLVDIRSRILNGHTLGNGGMPAEAHSWLMVKIQGCHYHLDITFDMTSNTKQYFNMTSREALSDRVIT